MNAADEAFRRFCRSGDPSAIAEVYDLTADRLLRAAGHLVPCLPAAEDLVQATFVVAIEKAGEFELERPVMPWLSGILANQARLARWRRAREKPAEIPPRAAAGADGPEPRAQRAELFRRVEQAVDKLPEHVRPVLTLRLLHGLQPAEIAHALGRPAATVRSQLARGLEGLRRQMPAGLAALACAHVGDGAVAARGLDAVREAVVSTAAATAATAAAGATAVGIGAGLVMQKTLVGLVVVGILAVAGVFAGGFAFADPAIEAGRSRSVALARGAIEAESTTDADVRVDEPGVERRAAAGETRPPAATLAVDEPPADGTCEVVVSVVWGEDGEPAPGVTVTATTDGGIDWRRPRARSDADGRARFRIRQGAPLRLSAMRGGAVDLRVEGEAMKVELAIPEGRVVRGVVVDTDGLPVRGASIWMSDPWRTDRGEVIATSDGDGGFALRGVGTNRYVAAWARGFEPSRVFSVKGDVGTEQRIEIVLAAGAGRLRGVVTDVHSQPVADAQVLVGAEQRPSDRRDRDGSWVSGPPPRLVQTGARGAFTIDGLESGDCVPVQVRAVGFGAWRRDVAVVVGVEQVVPVVLDASATLHGTVRYADGEPAVYSQVRVGVMSRFASALGYTDREGAYEIDGLPARDVEVEIAGRPGHAAATVPLTAGQRTRWDVVLEREDRGMPLLRGRIVDGSGAAMVGWRVVVSTLDRSSQEATRTDSEGRFAIAVAWSPFRLWAHEPGQWTKFPPILRDDLVVGAGEQLLRVPDQDLELGTVRARVVDRRGQPVPAQFQVWHEQVHEWREFSNDAATGDVEIRRLLPGRVRLMVRPFGHPWLDLEAFEVAAGTVSDLGDVVVEDGFAVSGVLRMADGGVVPDGIDLDLLDHRGRIAAVVERAGDRFGSGVVAPGQYRLRVQGAGVAKVERDVTVAGAEQRGIDIALERAARRDLVFELAQGTERPGALTVFLVDDQRDVVWSGGIGARDRLQVEASVLPGSYRLVVRARSGALLDTAFDVIGLAPAAPAHFVLRPVD